MANENKSPVNTNGSMIGRSDSDKVAFHGISPIARAQVAIISANLAGTLTGTTDGTIVDIAPVNVTSANPDNATDVEIETAVNVAVTSANLQFKELQAKLNETILKLNDLITALQNKGIIKA